MKIKTYLLTLLLFANCFALGQNPFVIKQKVIDSLIGKINTQQISLIKKSTSDKINNEHIELQIDSLENLSDSLKKEKLFLTISFIKNNLSSDTSLAIISDLIWKQESLNYSDTFVNLFNSLSERLKTSELGLKTSTYLNNFKKSSVGEFAPEFNLIDINYNEIKLNSLYNKGYVLLDFWASWCGPCKQDIPFLKSLKSSFHSLNLTIVGISRDDDLNAWRKAINEENTTKWIHISTKENKYPILDNYFIWAIPVKILIDNNGKIIGRWRGSGEKNKKDMTEKIKLEAEKN